MEALLGVPQLPVQVSHAALEDASKEARDEGPSDTCSRIGASNRVFYP